jgi:hypothetical protein
MKNLFKNFTLIVATAMAFSSCQQFNKDEAVQDLISSTNKFDLEKTKELLTDDFTYIDNDKQFNKAEYLNKLDSLKKLEFKSKVVSIENLDSLIKTEEEITNMVDSLLDVSPKLIHKKTYRFADNKIKSITLDTIINYDKYSESLNDKIIPFSTYVQYEHDIKDENEIFENIKKYLTEYAGLSKTEKKKFRTIGYLQGTFICKKCIYAKLEFKGKSTVVIYVGFIGFPFPTSYVIDEEYIRVRTDKSDLLFRIEDSNKLIGEGWAEGTYNKVK